MKHDYAIAIGMASGDNICVGMASEEAALEVMDLWYKFIVEGKVYFLGFTSASGMRNQFLLSAIESMTIIDLRAQEELHLENVKRFKRIEREADLDSDEEDGFR
jgi:hypothetical protein